MQASFITMRQRRTSELKCHTDAAPGLRYVAIDGAMRADSPMYVAVRRAQRCSNEQPEYVASHRHNVDSLYLFLGDGDGMRGLRAVVRVGDEEHDIESPVTVFIPAGMPHSYKLTGGSGFYLSIVLHGDYNGCTFPVGPPPSDPSG